MLSFNRPTPEEINDFIVQQSKQNFSYAEVGASKHLENLAPYNVDRKRICLGHGKNVFAAACVALENWAMFANDWTHLCWQHTPIKQGETVAILTKVFGIWWLNACRIVYVVTETEPIRKFGFAYGTLPTHAECGEERFLIEWHPSDDSVWYEVAAFSRPRYWMVRLGYPLARKLQKKFARDSMQAMKKAVTF